MKQDAVISQMSSARMTETILVILGSEEASPPGFLLGASRLVVGAGEQDDVFLSGVGVVPSHLRLIFVDDRITILAASQEIRINGVVVDQFPIDLEPLQVLSLSADTHITYGPVGSAWPSVPHWEMPVDESNDEALSSEESASAAVENSLEESHKDIHSSPNVPSVDQVMTTRDKVNASARLGVLVLVVSSLVVVALVLFDVFWGRREVVAPQGRAIELSENILDKLLSMDKVAYRSVRLDRRADGAISISGFIDSEDAYRRLSEQVRQQVVNSGGNVRLDALTLERLSALVRDHLVSYPMGYQMDAEGDKVRVLIFGIKQDSIIQERLTAELSRLADRIAPRQLELDFQLQTADGLVQEVMAALTRRSITQDMQVRIEANGARITGLVAAPVESEARTALNKIVEDFSSRLPLTVELKVDPKLNFTVVSLTQGGLESSATLIQRGKTQTFRVGESVFNTGELREVKSDGVVIALGRREMFIPLIR